VTYIEKDLKQVISESTFLTQHHSKQNEYPVFHRSEIKLGKLLGKGGFSDVYEVVGYDLNDEINNSLSV
jgi:hypothetical protein